jgi:hypothetical protein
MVAPGTTFWRFSFPYPDSYFFGSGTKLNDSAKIPLLFRPQQNQEKRCSVKAAQNKNAAR